MKTDDRSRQIAAGVAVLSAMVIMTPKAVHHICCTFVTAVTKYAVCVCVCMCVSCADATSRNKTDFVGCGMEHRIQENRVLLSIDMIGMLGLGTLLGARLMDQRVMTKSRRPEMSNGSEGC